MDKVGFAVIEMYGGQVEDVCVFEEYQTAEDFWYKEKLKKYFKHVNREFLTDKVENAGELLGYLDADDQARFIELWLEIHKQILDGEREEFLITKCNIY